MVRKAIPKKIRFEVFKRDKFTCQYCGKIAPDVILNVDHIHPVKDGGDNDIINLITSCADCNSGKGARKLSDAEVMAKKRKQLDELQDRREQLEMMYQWQVGLLDLDNENVNKLCDFWRALAPGWHVNEHEATKLKAWMLKYGFSEIMESMKICASSYLDIEDGKATDESWNVAFDKIPRVCTARKSGNGDLYYIRGVLVRRFGENKKWYAWTYLQKAKRAGASIESLKASALSADKWYDWCDMVDAFVKSMEGENDH